MINHGDVKNVPLLLEELMLEEDELIIGVEDDPVLPENNGEVSGEIPVDVEDATEGVVTLDTPLEEILVPMDGDGVLLAVFITIYYINSNILLLTTYILPN
jgi:hypothetical protein